MRSFSRLAVLLQAVLYTGKMLRGAKRADMPIQQRTEFGLGDRPRDAPGLGVTPSLLARADMRRREFIHGPHRRQMSVIWAMGCFASRCHLACNTLPTRQPRRRALISCSSERTKIGSLRVAS